MLQNKQARRKPHKFLQTFQTNFFMMTHGHGQFAFITFTQATAWQQKKNDQTNGSSSDPLLQL